MIKLRLPLIFAIGLTTVACSDNDSSPTEPTTEQPKKVLAKVGVRPQFLVDGLAESELKTALQQCADKPFYRSDFSIGHRGAAMQFPEHSKESYLAAARMGAGIIECDVTFTLDKELVCRHSQCDLATTTNILTIPELSSKCSSPFNPADPDQGISASATCCTSDITLAEFKTLSAKMDASDPSATTVKQFLKGTPDWRTDLYSSSGTVMSHKESIALFKSLGVKMTPELKAPSMKMPFQGTYSQQDYAAQMLAEYTDAGVDASQVYPQSFNLADIEYWIANNSEFAPQAVYLDGRYDLDDFNPNDQQTWSPTMDELAAKNIKIIAPPMWFLVTVENDKIVPSAYAKAAKAAGLNIITWTLERSGPLANGGGWYYKSIKDVITKDSDQLVLLDVLAQQVGVMGVFADWPATTTYYANCMGLVK